MHDERGTRLDEAIDAVARSLTSAPPSPAVRAAIRDRLDAPFEPDRAWRFYWSLAATVAGIVLLAVMWPSRESVVPVSAPSADVAEIPLSPVRPLREPRRGAAGTPLGASPGEPYSVDPTGARVTDTTIAAEPSIVAPDRVESAIEPLVAEGLVLEPLGSDLLAFDRLPAPMPLTIERLNVEPLPIR